MWKEVSITNGVIALDIRDVKGNPERFRPRSGLSAFADNDTTIIYNDTVVVCNNITNVQIRRAKFVYLYRFVNSMMESIPLYIHIPFCKRKCKYCDFYSVGYSPDLAGKYIDVVTGQIERLKEEGLEFSTIYIGGGTPSVLSLGLMKRLLRSLVQNSSPEFTVELNPESVTIDKLKLLFDFNVNRLSIGIQSLYDDVLCFLGRLHDSKQALRVLSQAKKTGFNNLSVDLIYGVPNKDFPRWKNELEVVKDLPVKHASLYSLTYNKGTPLFYELKKGGLSPVPAEKESDMYMCAVDFFEKNKMHQYEVSNFAFEGFQSRHNLYYWANSPYLGLGPGAASYINNERKKYKNNILVYIEKINSGCEDELFQEREILSPVRRARETAALNIRRKEGINCREFKQHTGFDVLELEKGELNKLRREDLVFLKDDKIRLTKRGFLLCDYVCRELV